MASVTSSAALADNDPRAWNEAYERLVHFLNSFGLGDEVHAARVALQVIDEAKGLHRLDSSKAPTAVTMELLQKKLTEWLAANLEEKNPNPSQLLTTGYIALLLSRVFQTAPDSFLATPLPEELRQALRETLVVTGPDLNLSRMTPRHLDYGPMLNIARQTWHRWNARELVVAVLFWTAIYVLFYWWLSNHLL